MIEYSSLDDSKPENGSPRSFGILVACIFVAVALLPLLSGLAPRWWAAGLSVSFFAVAIWIPAKLAGLTRWWLAFGEAISKIVGPIAMAVVFFGVFSVYGGLLRLLGRDALKVRIDRSLDTYWIDRPQAEDAVTHFKNPF